MEIDLVDVSKFYKQNQGIKFLLVALDAWSKYMWVIPIKSKETSAVVEAFKEIITQAETVPKIVCSDKEKPVQSKPFKNLCKKLS